MNDMAPSPAPIQCDHCHCDFVPVVLHQRFCSDSCRVMHWQQPRRGDPWFKGSDYDLFKRLGLPWVGVLLANQKEHWHADDRAKVARQQPLTWKQITKLEPRLLSLWHLAKAAQDHRVTDSYCANMIWYKSFKPILCALVGWSADDPPDLRLITCDAYDIAYETIYKALPNCRNCGCL